VRAFPGLDVPPLIAERGEGAWIYDADGHAYVDYCCSWGALLLGHAHPRVVRAAARQLERGSTFGIATQIEQELAAEVTRLMPSIEKVRFVSSGTEATMTALRLARGHTGRSLIVKFDGNYHGHSDALLVRAGSGVLGLRASTSRGVPEEVVAHTASLPYNDAEAARAFLRTHPAAAVIVEPIAANMGVVPASCSFLETLREETRASGAVLIFDEVISGFRVGLQGAQGLYGVFPDLTCLGKIVGGGFPAAACGGKREIMDHLAPLGEVYQAGTLSGNPLAMCAGVETLQEAQRPGFYEALRRKTALLAQPIREEFSKGKAVGCVNDVCSLLTPFFGVRAVQALPALDAARYRELFCFLFERGVYVPPSPYEAWFLSSAHTEEQIGKTRDLVLEFMRRC
jgi:glutamate-1-semialdehyde 2,1-aminomutase